MNGERRRGYPRSGRACPPFGCGAGPNSGRYAMKSVRLAVILSLAVMLGVAMVRAADDKQEKPLKETFGQLLPGMGAEKGFEGAAARVARDLFQGRRPRKRGPAGRGLQADGRETGPRHAREGPNLALEAIGAERPRGVRGRRGEDARRPGPARARRRRGCAGQQSRADRHGDSRSEAPFHDRQQAQGRAGRRPPVPRGLDRDLPGVGGPTALRQRSRRCRGCCPGLRKSQLAANRPAVSGRCPAEDPRRGPLSHQ